MVKDHALSLKGRKKTLLKKFYAKIAEKIKLTKKQKMVGPWKDSLKMGISSDKPK
jgi:hypothetical protein